MKCPNCKNQLIQKQGDLVRLRVKGKIEFIDDMCRSTCYWCGAGVNFHFPLGDLSNLDNVRYVIKH